MVEVTGSVLEFIPSQDLTSPPVTEIVLPTVTIVSTGNPLPNAIPLTAIFPNPVGPHDQLERIEGMLASVASLTVVAPTSSIVTETSATAISNGVLYGVVTGIPRPFREPGIQVPNAAPSGTIPPIPVFDGNPELIRLDTDAQPGTIAIDVSTDAIITNVVGPIDYAFRSYTILPGAAIIPTIAQQGILAAIPIADKNEKQFTVASYNMERFFDTTDDAGTGDVILTPLAFQNRLSKASLAIRNVLKTPDIIAVVEMENLSTLQTLATKINNDVVTDGKPNPNYTAHLVEGNDVGGIDVGFLVKNNVTISEVVQESKNTTFIDPSDLSVDLLNDRPSLRLTGVVNHPSGKTFPITVFVNHLRSLNGVANADASGIRVREKRKKQAEDLANIVQARQVANPSERIVLMGDFNAFEFNDGLVDIINTLKGTPTPDIQTAVQGDGADLVTPNLFIPTLPVGSYSYSFNGNSQFLDHGLITQNMTDYIEKIEYVKLNADFAGTFRNDATRPERLSDHDPLVATINFCPIASTFNPTNLTASSSSICLGSSIVLDGTCPAGYQINWYDSETSIEAIGNENGFTVKPMINTTYYATCKDLLCESNRIKVGDITVIPLQKATSNTTIKTTISMVTEFVDENCKLIATLKPTGSTPASDLFKAIVWVETTPIIGPFVGRRYEISPSGFDGRSGDAIITLYFTQDEFDAYNAANTSSSSTDDLPTSVSDGTGKSRLRIVKYPGISSNSTGLPSSFIDIPETINPADTDIIFKNGFWEITFPVSSFSGFFVKGQTEALPITLISFSGKNIGNKNVLSWKTANEKAFYGFEIQNSMDGKAFEKIGFVKGNNIEKYEFIDLITNRNTNNQLFYYRLKMIDLIGTSVLSKIIAVENENQEETIVSKVYPNPVIDKIVFVDVTAEKAGNWKTSIYNVLGAVNGESNLYLLKGLNKLPIDLSKLSQGIYYFKLENEIGEKFIRKILKK